MFTQVYDSIDTGFTNILHNTKMKWLSMYRNDLVTSLRIEKGIFNGCHRRREKIMYMFFGKT